MAITLLVSVTWFGGLVSRQKPWASRSILAILAARYLQPDIRCLLLTRMKVLYNDDGSVKGIATNDVGLDRNMKPKVFNSVFFCP